MKKGLSKALAYIFGDIPDCPAGHDDICIECAVDLWEEEETPCKVFSGDIGEGISIEARLY